MPPESRSTEQKDSSSAPPVSTIRHAPIKVDRLLSRISDRYPYGFPQRMLVDARRRHSEELASRKKVLFLLASATSSISEGESSLLESIIEKGLTLTKEEVALQVCDLSVHGNTLTEWLRDQSTRIPSLVVIAMGFQQASHGSWTGDDIHFLHTVSLTEVLSSKESKRLFWGHLQGVISRVKAE